MLAELNSRRVLYAVILALKTCFSRLQHHLDYSDRLIQPFHSFPDRCEIVPVGFILGLVPARADSKNNSAIGYATESGGHFGNECGTPEGVADYESSKFRLVSYRS